MGDIPINMKRQYQFLIKLCLQSQIQMVNLGNVTVKTDVTANQEHPAYPLLVPYGQAVRNEIS